MMTTLAALPEASSEPDGDQRVEFSNIGWDGYSTLLKLRRERSVPKMIYLDGSLVLVSPSLRHENLRDRLGLLVSEVMAALAIRFILSGSTTLRRRSKRGGVEGDLSYYLTNLARIRGKKKINLRVDPAPDLAIEVVVSHDADEAIEVYRRFRVPELWICDERDLTILRLGDDGHYTAVERSLALPTLAATEVHAWATRDEDEDDWAWLMALRKWVAEVLVPRHRDRAQQDPASSDQHGK
jgi:Uma2 family endonuclease